MLPLVCNDAIALLFMFDLSRKSTLTSIKNWYKQARLLNKTASPFLIGTKYDYFAQVQGADAKEETTRQVRSPRSRPSFRPVLAVLTQWSWSSGPQVRQGHEGSSYFLLRVPLDQRAEDLQGTALLRNTSGLSIKLDCVEQSVRTQVQRQEGADSR